MGATTLISESEYLQMTFDGPEAEYVDGEVRERSMPTFFHSRAASWVHGMFFMASLKHPLFPCPELRMRVAPGRIRVPDLVVFAYHTPSNAIPMVDVPHVIVEIVSPDDRHDEVMVKLADYQAFGVPHIWLVDPALRSLSIYRDSSLTSVPELSLPEFDLRVKIAEVFAYLADLDKS